jgi:hypothetical protein
MMPVTFTGCPLSIVGRSNDMFGSGLDQEALQRRRFSFSMSVAISHRLFLLRNVKVNFPSSGTPESEL